MPFLGSWLVVVGLIFAAVLMLPIVRMTLWPKMDVIETHESTARGAAALLCVASYVVLLAAFGACLVLRASWGAGARGLLRAMPLGAVLWFPLVSAATAYLRLPQFFKRAFAATGQASPDVRLGVEEAADALGLRGGVDVRVSGRQHEGYAPVVFGRSGMRPVLVLPPDLAATVEAAADGKADAAQVLMRFVFLHELAHVRNGDYVIHSWGTALIQTMRRWPPLLVLVLGAYAVFAGARLPCAMAGTVLWLSAVFGLFHLLTWRQLQRHRERLADWPSPQLVGAGLYAARAAYSNSNCSGLT
jgi:hypothetical protein